MLRDKWGRLKYQSVLTHVLQWVLPTNPEKQFIAQTRSLRGFFGADINWLGSLQSVEVCWTTSWEAGPTCTKKNNKLRNGITGSDAAVLPSPDYRVGCCNPDAHLSNICLLKLLSVTCHHGPYPQAGLRDQQHRIHALKKGRKQLLCCTLSTYARLAV